MRLEQDVTTDTELAGEERDDRNILMNGDSAAVSPKNVFKGIGIFAHLDEASFDKLEDIFVTVIKNIKMDIISYNCLVDGLYIVVAGEVDVMLPEYDKPIAVLGEGNSFGEMSVIEKGETASATVRVSSHTAEFLFCENAKLERLISEDSIFAHGFYKSAAMMMSSRLRNSNDKINNEIAKGVISAAQLIEDLELDEKIQQTSERLDEAGYNIVSKLSVMLTDIRELLQADEIPVDKLRKVCKNLEEVYYGESQKFDRLTQEMQLIEQYFENLKRMIDGNRQLAVRGDSSLFHHKED